MQPTTGLQTPASLLFASFPPFQAQPLDAIPDSHALPGGCQHLSLQGLLCAAISLNWSVFKSWSKASQLSVPAHSPDPFCPAKFQTSPKPYSPKQAFDTHPFSCYFAALDVSYWERLKSLKWGVITMWGTGEGREGVFSESIPGSFTWQQTCLLYSSLSFPLYMQEAKSGGAAEQSEISAFRW